MTTRKWLHKAFCFLGRATRSLHPSTRIVPGVIIRVEGGRERVAPARRQKTGWWSDPPALFFCPRAASVAGMKKALLAAAGAAFALTAPTASAQSAQERLDDRYNRALAAGYKALMLCGAIGHAERAGEKRTPEHVTQWELTGIYPALDPIIRELSFRIERFPKEKYEANAPKRAYITHVAVDWADDMPPRLAQFIPGKGCSVLPIGFAESALVHGEPRDYTPALFIPPPPPIMMRSNASEVIDAAFDGTYGEGSRTTAVIVEQNSRLVGQKYASGFGRVVPQRTWSVAKSVAASIVGIAVQNGAANVEDGAGLGVGEEDPRKAITIDHALRMASGRYSDTPGNRTDPLYWGGTTVGERAQNWPLVHAPGTVYRYANNDTLAAVQAIQPFVEEQGIASLVRGDLQMSGATAEADWQGNHVLSSQVWASPLDFLRLGTLYLNDGVNRGAERILPEGWREYVSDPSGPQPKGTNWGYGAGWWTFRRPEGNAFDGIPDDAFAARGNRGQYLVVIPSRNVVIVRRGEDMVGTRFDIATFTRDVLAALDE